ncbi:MAG: hypothetical protein ABI833_03745 [Acidobacteriota bacterium]
MEPPVESKHHNHGNEGSEGVRVHHETLPPYWKRAHHDWRFWIGLVLMLVAISIYVLSENLAFLPHP